MRTFAALVQSTSTAVDFANGNFYMGDIPEILRSKAADARVYTFINGCDSPAGCGDRHTWVLRFTRYPLDERSINFPDFGRNITHLPKRVGVVSGSMAIGDS